MAHRVGHDAAEFGQLVQTPVTSAAFYVGGDNAMKATGAAKRFTQLSDGDTIAVRAQSIDDPSKWEVALCTYNNTTSMLARTTILASSNSDSAVNFKRADGSGNGQVSLQGLAKVNLGVVYTITSFSADRSMAGNDTTAAVVAATLATLINDLIDAGILRGTVAA